MVEQVGLLEKIESIINSQGDTSFWKRKPIVLRFALFFACILAIIYISYIILPRDDYSLPQESSIRSGTNLSSKASKDHIYVDLSGAINKPGVYKVDNDTRLFMLIELAGGLHIDADRDFIARNYNLSVPLSDQQKIYIPTVFDIQDGLLIENQKIVNTELDQLQNTDSVIENAQTPAGSSLVSINSADMSSLMDLPGIGEVTAQRIIASRPYASLQDILDKGVIKQSLYDKIKNMIAP